MVNYLDNGGFHGNLDEWTGTGAILRSDGYPRLGCAQLEDGENIAQAQDIGEDQLYTLHYFYKPAASATLTVSYGSVTQTHTGEIADVWHEGVLVFALDANGSDSVTFAASGGTVLVDTVTLLPGALAMSRADIAARVERRLGALASDKSLSKNASADGPEGDYSDAIDHALRSTGAVNRYGDPDITRLPFDQINSVFDVAEVEMLEHLRRVYSLESDVSLGPRSESRAQIQRAIGQILGGLSAKEGQAVTVRRLRFE